MKPELLSKQIQQARSYQNTIVDCSPEEKFLASYLAFNESALNDTQVREELKRLLEPLTLESKAYQDLVTSNKLPEHTIFKDTHDLLNQNNKNRINQIRATNCNLPDLLLDNLELKDPQVDKKIDTIFESINRSTNLVYLIGSSGCGKTRTIYEYLSRHFGLFFAASTRFSGGSSDLQTFIKSSPNGRVHSLRLVLEFVNLVIVRTRVLETLQTIQAERKQAQLTPWHWLIIQEMPDRLFSTHNDIFEHIGINIKCMQALNVVFGGKIEAPEKLFPVFIDQTQVLLASNDYMSSRSLDEAICTIKTLRIGLSDQLQFDKDQFDKLECDNSLINLFAFASLKLVPENPEKVSNKYLVVLSGTCLQVKKTVNPVEGSILKPMNRLRYITLGNFLNFESFRDYIKRYTDKLDDRLVELHSILQGRYRFTASFLAYFLQCGDVDQSLALTRKELKDMMPTSIESYLRVPKGTSMQEYFERPPFIKTLLKNYLADNTIQNPIFKDRNINVYFQLTIVTPDIDKVKIISSVEQIVCDIKMVEPLVFELLNSARQKNEESRHSRE